jgi:predicted transposase YbfD/YdcC
MGFRRRFRTQEEQIGALEEYLSDLQAEAKAVEELIARLKA